MRRTIKAMMLLGGFLGAATPAFAEGPATPAPVVEASSASVAPSPARLRLVGVMLGSAQVLVWDERIGEYQLRKLGDDLGGARIVGLDADSVTVERNGERAVLDVEAAPQSIARRGKSARPATLTLASPLEAKAPAAKVAADAKAAEAKAPEAKVAEAKPAAPTITATIVPTTPAAPAAPVTASAPVAVAAAAPVATPSVAATAPAAATTPVAVAAPAVTPPVAAIAAPAAPVAPIATAAPIVPAAPAAPATIAPPVAAMPVIAAPVAPAPVLIAPVAPAPVIVPPAVIAPMPVITPVAPVAPVTPAAPSHVAVAPVAPLAPLAPPPPAAAPADDEQFELILERALFAQQLEDFDNIAQQVAIAPNRGGGYRLLSLRPGSYIESLGLRTGDVLLRVDGRMVNTADDAARAYAWLRATDHFTLDVLRDGAQVQLHFRLAASTAQQ